MAEPSPRDKQRLEALQQRLAAAKEEKRAWSQERKDLRVRSAAGERTAKQLERTADEVERLKAELSDLTAKLKAERQARAQHERALRDRDEQIKGIGTQLAELLAENRRQSERLEGLEADNENLQRAASQALSERDAALTELRSAIAARTDLERRVEALEAENAKVSEALKAARSQLEADERPQLLPPAEVGGLVQDLLGQIRRSLPGLDVRDGELTLRVAFAGAGDAVGFVIPTTDYDEAISGPLHELALRFDRSFTA